MDIKKAWSNLADAVANAEWGAAAEIADDVVCWLARDGFLPNITGIRAFDKSVLSIKLSPTQQPKGLPHGKSRSSGPALIPKRLGAFRLQY